MLMSFLSSCIRELKMFQSTLKMTCKRYHYFHLSVSHCWAYFSSKIKLNKIEPIEEVSLRKKNKEKMS